MAECDLDSAALSSDGLSSRQIDLVAVLGSQNTDAADGSFILHRYHRGLNFAAVRDKCRLRGMRPRSIGL